MHKPNRLTGIDLCRGLAAFAVILVHSGDETWGIPISESAIQFRYLFYFSVPFFLAVSFYFATKKLPVKISLNFWHKKFKRIVIPYLLWSFFYVISKSILFLVSNNSEKVFQLLADPIAIIFLGGASYHLYFIPLLVSGTVCLCFANYLSRQRFSILFLSLLSVFSIIIYQLSLIYKNDFNLAEYTAFPSLLQLIPVNSFLYSIWRIFLVNIAWFLRCLPYFMIAMLVNQLLQKKNSQWIYRKPTTTLLFFIFLLVNILGNNLLPRAVSEIAIAYSLLLFGISVSQQIKDNTLITNLGLCSFGIYLIHPLIKSVIEIFLIKILPQLTQNVSIISMLTYSISSFLVSWLFIYLLRKNNKLSQYV
ncbi:MAG: acyltransferase family protein [Mastigocoleus sp.]